MAYMYTIIIIKEEEVMKQREWQRYMERNGKTEVEKYANLVLVYRILKKNKF